MPFFQPVYTPADQAFGNLLRLIDGFDTVAVPSCNPPAAKQAKTNNSKAVRHQQPQQQQQQQQQQLQQQPHKQQQQTTPPALAALQALLPGTTSAVLGRPFNPRFDVRETENAYELHGELAGVDRKDVILEFTEPQTLVVSGRIERNYSSASPSASPSEDAVPDAVSDAGDEPTVPSDEGARTPATADEDEPFTEVTHEGRSRSRSSSPASRHAATVADADDEDVTMTPAVPATTTATTTKTAAKKQPAKKTTTTVAKQAATPTERYWVQERAVGEFQRTFNFPVPVDEANVRASLDNGILSVIVPKAVKPQTRRIAVL